MKRFVFLTATLIAVAAAICACTKEQYTSDDSFSSIVEEKTQGVTLVIDAQNVTTADIYFLDEDNVAISSNTVVIPATQTPVDVNFVTSDGSTPKYLFTPGCVNGDAMGRIPIPAQSVTTKAAEPILVVIRK